jgi:hypothetical protein
MSWSRADRSTSFFSALILPRRRMNSGGASVFVQLVREQEPSIGGYRGSPELDAEPRIERKVNRGDE